MNDYKKVLETHGVLTFTPGGNSMWPFIKNSKSSVVIVPAKDIKKHDIVLFDREDGKTVFHRVIRKNGDNTYTVCGDNQFVPEVVTRGQIYGLLQGYYRGKKFVDVNNNRIYKFLVNLWCSSLGVRHLVLAVLSRLNIR